MGNISFLNKTIRPIIGLTFILCLSIGCTPSGVAHTPVPERTQLPAGGARTPVLSDQTVRTLNSLEKVDDYPLYVMHYYGTYNPNMSSAVRVKRVVSMNPLNLTPLPPGWGCSLFMAAGEANHGLYGRNFDWEYSPALLLFTDPPGGYASVSMVDIAYLGFGGAKSKGLTELSPQERQALLNAPFLPFDGMNEYGLTVGMAAVPSSKMPHDPTKQTIDSLGAIRMMLDHARNVDEAAAILQSNNINMEGGPTIHYLLADSAKRSALVEFSAGETVVIPNRNAWHLATNHLHNTGDETGHSGCWRYDRMYQRLGETEGRLSPQDAQDLLRAVSQESTQWSVVYSMMTGEVQVAMGRKYAEIHTFHLPPSIGIGAMGDSEPCWSRIDRTCSGAQDIPRNRINGNSPASHEFASRGLP